MNPPRTSRAMVRGVGVGVFMLLVAGGLSEFEGLDLDCPEDVGDLLNASGGEFFDYLVPVDPGVVTEDVAKRVLICLQIGGAEGLIGHALED
jgi:hypothetical protein